MKLILNNFLKKALFKYYIKVIYELIILYYFFVITNKKKYINFVNKI